MSPFDSQRGRDRLLQHGIQEILTAGRVDHDIVFLIGQLGLDQDSARSSIEGSGNDVFWKKGNDFFSPGRVLIPLRSLVDGRMSS